ncbi:MAG: DUF4160 domain-containing protein [Chitinophagaceae bacterium]|nr:DUF4160 domain-containing protein [Chitinophagaceae bacterium]
MPVVLVINGFRFFFYSNENNEPIHIHVAKADADGKIWLEPIIKIAYLHGFSPKEENYILEIVEANIKLFKQKWNGYFGK